MVEIHRNLEENAYNVDLAVDVILAEHCRQAGKFREYNQIWVNSYSPPFVPPPPIGHMSCPHV